MIRLRIDDESLNAIRLTFSPLWETIGSLALLARYRGTVPTPYKNWVRILHQGRSVALAEELARIIRKPDLSALPGELFNVPDPSRSTLEAELSHVSDCIADDSRQRTLEFIEQYWEWAIAPYWKTIRASLEEEILFRGRTLAVEGPEAMLRELGGTVSWNRPVLTAPYHRDLDHTVRKSRLLLIPTAFSGGIRMFAARDGVLAMSYQVRATALFHGDTTRKTHPELTDRLAIMIGTRRAQVMRSLVMPKTTTAVAESLGLAKSTVSQHLAVLTEAGVVWRQRLGGQVFYQLDREGFLLLEHLGQS
ncbi:hypothetical protein GCM10027072_10290 [Streptomyces bullii]